jgi:mono/diheme cytochrome c family protein
MMQQTFAYLRSITLPCVIAGTMILTVPAAMAADIGQGAKIAQRWCATCHVVTPGQPAAKADAPSFASISAARKVPEIAGFLMQSHPSMPDMNLSRAEIADLIAYMQSLAPPLDPLKPQPQKDDPPKQFRG